MQGRTNIKSIRPQSGWHATGNTYKRRRIGSSGQMSSQGVVTACLFFAYFLGASISTAAVLSALCLGARRLAGRPAR